LFKDHIMKLKKTLFLFDTIGIGVFTIIGIEKSLQLGISPIFSILMGVVTAVMGGVLRDTFCNDIPLIFRKEIYATACVVGGVLYLILRRFHLEPNTILLLTIVFIILIRLICIRYKLSLPLMHPATSNTPKSS